MEKKQNSLKRFRSYFRPVIGLFIIDTFFALFIAGIAVGTPWATQYLIQQITDKNQEGWLIGMGIFISMLAVRVASNYIVILWGHIMGGHMEVNMRKDALKKLHNLTMSNFDKTSTGSYISRIVTDLKDIPEFAHHAPEDFITGVVTAIGGLTYAFLQSWIMGVVLIAVLIIGVFIVFIIRTKWKVVWKELKQENSRLSASIGHQVEAVAEVKSFHSESYELKRFQKVQKDYLGAYKKLFKFEGMFSVFNIITMSLTTLIAFLVGGSLVINGQITVPQLFGLTSVAAILNAPIQKFVNVYSMISRGMSAVDRFYEFMDQPTELAVEGIRAGKFKGLIEFKNVHFEYIDPDGDKVVVLENFNLTIKEGQKVALVGETGIGKSTILKLLLRFYEIQKGQILIDGVDIKEYSMSSLRMQMAYIQQQATMFEDTIENNIRYGKPDATLAEIKKAAKDAYVNDFINKLPKKYETVAGPRGAKLSGGQKQRIALARAFIASTSLFLMDEATSALDNDTEKKIKNSIEKLSKGKTSLTVAHRLSTIKNSDMIYIIGKGGTIIEKGNHAKLIKEKGEYFKLYNA